MYHFSHFRYCKFIDNELHSQSCATTAAHLWGLSPSQTEALSPLNPDAPSPAPSPGQAPAHSVSDLVTLGTWHKRNHTVFILLWLHF